MTRFWLKTDDAIIKETLITDTWTMCWHSSSLRRLIDLWSLNKASLQKKKPAETSVWAESSSRWGSALWQNSQSRWAWLPLRSTYFWRRRLSWRADTPRTCVSGTRRGCRHSICNTRARLWAAELLVCWTAEYWRPTHFAGRCLMCPEI